MTRGCGRPVVLAENFPVCPSLANTRPGLVMNFGGLSLQILGLFSTAGTAGRHLESKERELTSLILSHTNVHANNQTNISDSGNVINKCFDIGIHSNPM